MRFRGGCTHTHTTHHTTPHTHTHSHTHCHMLIEHTHCHMLIEHTATHTTLAVCDSMFKRTRSNPLECSANSRHSRVLFMPSHPRRNTFVRTQVLTQPHSLANALVLQRRVQGACRCECTFNKHGCAMPISLLQLMIITDDSCYSARADRTSQAVATQQATGGRP